MRNRIGPISAAITNRAALLDDLGVRPRRCRNRPYDVEPLADGGVAVSNYRGCGFKLDIEDWEQVKDCRFFVDATKRSVTIKTPEGTRLLARVLLAAPRGVLVDHINGDPRDNRRANLRLCSPTENARNMALPSHNTTGFKGVSPTASRRYKAYAMLRDRQHHLGIFSTPDMAAQAYDAFAREHFGSFACVNFPREGEQSVHRETDT